MIIKIIKKPDDPLCATRASIGGDPTIGYYLVFRGNKEKIVACIETILEALKNNHPIIEEDD